MLPARHDDDDDTTVNYMYKFEILGIKKLSPKGKKRKNTNMNTIPKTLGIK